MFKQTGTKQTVSPKMIKPPRGGFSFLVNPFINSRGGLHRSHSALYEPALGCTLVTEPIWPDPTVTWAGRRRVHLVGLGLDRRSAIGLAACLVRLPLFPTRRHDAKELIDMGYWFYLFLVLICQPLLAAPQYRTLQWEDLIPPAAHQHAATPSSAQADHNGGAAHKLPEP